MKRDISLDALKFILILLVILGHVLEPYLSSNKFTDSLYSVIYTFHMPLFIYLSGYFSKVHDANRLKSQLKRLIEIYLTVQIIGYLPLVYLGKFSVINLITPWWISWYLLSLCFWKIIGYFILKKGLKKNAVILICFLLGLIIGFIPFIGLPLSLSRTIVFLPFFVLGLFSESYHIKKIRRINWITPFIFFTGLFVIFFLSKTDWNLTLYGSHNYYSGNPLYNLFYRALFYTVASIGSVCLLSFCFMNKTLSKEGENTLIYYIFHGFILFYLRIYFDKISYAPSFLELTLVFTIVVILIHIASKTSSIKWLLTPYSSFKELKSK